MKPLKVGSTTAAGVTVRMARLGARRHLLRLNSSIHNETLDYTMCQNHFTHGRQIIDGVAMSVAERIFGARSKSQSFLWTTLRDPTKRMVSQFFHFMVSRSAMEPTDANFRSYIDTWWEERHDYYLGTLAFTRRFNRTIHDPIQVANHMLDNYDFVAITERMDESLVVLAMLLQVPLTDLLHLNSKQSGRYDDLCKFIQPSFVSPAMQTYFSSAEWQDRIQYDHALYVAANRSLDMTIQLLGRSEVQANLKRYRSMQVIAERECLPVTVFPCDAQGRPNRVNDCLRSDLACGLDCLDRVAERMDREITGS